MNKTAKNAIAAFMNKTSGTFGFATVHQSPDQISLLRYRGNLIAKIESGILYISNAGYLSNTTVCYLNAIPNVRVNVKQGVMYLNSKPMPNDKFVECYAINE